MDTGRPFFTSNAANPFPSIMQAGMSTEAILPFRQPTMALCAPTGKADDRRADVLSSEGRVQPALGLSAAPAIGRRSSDTIAIETGIDAAIMPPHGSCNQMIHRKRCRTSRVRETLSIPDARERDLVCCDQSGTATSLGGRPVEFCFAGTEAHTATPRWWPHGVAQNLLTMRNRDAVAE